MRYVQRTTAWGMLCGIVSVKTGFIKHDIDGWHVAPFQDSQDSSDKPI